MGTAWIVDAVRTPVGRRGGGLASVHAVELGALPLRALLARTGIDPGHLDDVIYGCTSAVGELGSDVGRLCALEAGFPVSVTGVQINRLDASSDQALHFATMGVASGHQGLVIAGGVASASRVPLASDRELHGAMATWPEQLAWRFTLIPAGRSADLVARRHRLTRPALEAYALRSHQRAAASRGATAAELVPIVLSPGREVSQDEGIRPDLSLETLARQTPAFGVDGMHTAGTSAAAADGAAAVLVASDDARTRFGLSAVGRIVGTAVVGEDPTLALTGSVAAARRVLDAEGLRPDQIDVVEIHEGFASVPLGAIAALELDPDRVNPRGGALAMGHVGGAAGVGRLVSLLDGLRVGGGRYGLLLTATGFGQASATLIEGGTP